MADIVNEQGKEPEVSKEDMEKLESVKKADAAVKSMHDFTSPEVLYDELIASIKKYHPSTDITMIQKAYETARGSPQGSEEKVRGTLHYSSFMCCHYSGGSGTGQGDHCSRPSSRCC